MPKDKAAISNALFHWNQRLSGNGSVVVLEGAETDIQRAKAIIQQFALKKDTFFARSELPKDKENLPQAHLLNQGTLTSQMKKQHPSARWMFLEMPEDSARVPVFSFGLAEGILELLARGDIDRAFSHYKTVTGYKDMTFQEFELLISGDEQMAAEYPFTTLVKVDWTEAIKLYQLTRIVNIYA
jgi:hypothetical protein